MILRRLCHCWFYNFPTSTITGWSAYTWSSIGNTMSEIIWLLCYFGCVRLLETDMEWYMICSARSAKHSMMLCREFSLQDYMNTVLLLVFEFSGNLNDFVDEFWTSCESSAQSARHSMRWSTQRSEQWVIHPKWSCLANICGYRSVWLVFLPWQGVCWCDPSHSTERDWDTQWLFVLMYHDFLMGVPWHGP